MHWIFWWYDTTKICWARFSISISSRNLKITMSLIVNLGKEIYCYQQSRWLFICCWIHYWVNQQSKTNAFTWLVYVTEIDLYNVFRKWLPCPRCNSARNAPCFGISSWTDAPRCWGRFSKMIILLESWQEIFENFFKQFMNIHWENIKDGFRSEYKLLKADQWIDQGELYDYNSVMHYLSLEYSKGLLFRKISWHQW